MKKGEHKNFCQHYLPKEFLVTGNHIFRGMALRTRSKLLTRLEA